MAAGLGCSSGRESGLKSTPGATPPDPLRARYPAVCEEETPLPRQWGTKNKHNYLGLSHSNLRVHYKGQGKNHKDAASVQSNYPIPAACGIYYFEVKVISKGREGYMGIGLSTHGVNMNRLPGWEKNSYGYHGDDGNSFCSSGNGQSYGPTFTTGDVIGCCVNLVDRSCFYTKNGVNLGLHTGHIIGGRSLMIWPVRSPGLDVVYIIKMLMRCGFQESAIGLQTPGETVEANFGQNPFLFDIDDYMKEWRQKIRSQIDNFPLPNKNGEWHTTMHKIVTSYLIHNGYCSTAEAFGRCVGQPIDEELASIRNRQKIQKMILSGKIREAIDTTRELYPGLLDTNPNLLFNLKCRQFIEMVNGTDLCPDMAPAAIETPLLGNTVPASLSPLTTPSPQQRLEELRGRTRSKSWSPVLSETQNGHSTTGSGQNMGQGYGLGQTTGQERVEGMEEGKTVLSRLGGGDSAGNGVTTAGTGSISNGSYSNGTTNSHSAPWDSEVDDMDTTETVADGDKVNGTSNGSTTNGTTSTTRCLNGTQERCSSRVSNQNNREEETEMDTDCERAQSINQSSNACDRSSIAETLRLECGVARDLERPREQVMREENLERILEFGRDLHTLVMSLPEEQAELNRKRLKEAFSLLAYSDPWSSSVGHQLNPVQREPICTALNSAILELQGLPKQPPLELAVSHAQQCLQVMARAGIGSSAFANVTDYLSSKQPSN